MPAPIAVNGDTIGGVTIATASSLLTKAYGQPIILDGDPLPSHGTGVHAAPVAQANPAQALVVEGKKVVRDTIDPASCGDIIVPAGANLQTVIVGP
jgi:uncharacterized Zn-binding protein involved in type VI secretion